MAWAFRGSGTAVTGNNGSSLANIPLPTGWQAGDLHLLQFQNYGGTSARTPPTSLSGWNPVPGTGYWSNGTTYHALYYRVAQAGDGAVTLSLSGTGATNDTQLARIHGFYGRAGATVTIDQTGTASTNASADDIGPITGITPANTALIVVSCGKSNDFNGSATLANYTLATNITESTTGNDAGMALLYRANVSGATGNLTVTDDGATASAGLGLGILVSFKETLTKSYTGSGGGVTAGSATTARVGAPVTKSYTGSGGALTAGAATTAVLKVYGYSGSGGAVSAGSATTDLIELTTETYTYVASGGATATGTAELARGKAYEAAGGALAAGAADYAKGKHYVATGGAVAAGAADLAKTKAYEPTGGAAAAGLAVTSLVPDGVVVYGWVGSGGVTAVGSADAALTTVPSAPATGGRRRRARHTPVAWVIPEPQPHTFAYVASGGARARGRARTSFKAGQQYEAYLSLISMAS